MHISLTKITTLSALGLLVLAGQSSTAQPAKSVEEKAAFLADLEHLKKDRPADFEKAKRVFILTAELLLGRAGYGIALFDGVLDEKTVEALRLYEKSRGIPVTGDPLTFETLETIRKDLSALDEKAPSLPRRSVYTGQWDSGYVSASGTWTILGEDQAFPQQTSKLDCHRETATCTEATAILTYDKGQPRLSLDVDIYDIERWDQYEVVTKPRQFGCTRYVKRIARLQKAASGLRSTTAADAECKGLDQAEKYLNLADGFDVYLKLQEVQNKKWREIMVLAPGLLDRLEDAGSRKK